MQLLRPEDLHVPTLGPCEVPSPFQGRGELFVNEERRILAVNNTLDLQAYQDEGLPPPAFERAGARETIYFDPAGLTCAVVTCGGLCPGVNDVIRAIVLAAVENYGVRRVLGFRYGYAGLAPGGREPMDLTPGVVDRIHEQGGTLLGTSRGPRDLGEMAETLRRREVGVLFAIGGDGTLRGASALAEEVHRRGMKTSVIGIPKTIDNDIHWVQRSFGFGTAVEIGAKILEGAHAEARGHWNGIGLVKLMGRHAGFIAAEATLASSDADFCLVPEVPFTLEGRGGFLEALGRRLERRCHAVVVVAEGAGQEMLQDPDDPERDASGNVRLKDVGLHLKTEIKRHFHERGVEVNIKYIDPSYAIRSVSANALDSTYCALLGRNAVHAGMAGRTGIVVGWWNHAFTHVPIGLAAGEMRTLDPRGDVWRRVLETTRQPASMVGSPG